MVRVHGLFQKDLKNRSSKHLSFMTGPGFKDILRKVSNTQLEYWARHDVSGADNELARRREKKDKKESK